MLSRLPHRRSSRSMPLLVCAVALSTACGSTVATGPGGQVVGGAPMQDDGLVQDPTLAAPGEDGLGDGGPGALDPAPGLALPEGSGGTVDAPGGSSGSTGGGTAPAPGQAPAGGGGSTGSAGGQAGAGGFPAKGRGYDEKTLLIGVGIQRSASESGKAIGVNVTTGNQQRQVEAVIADINARGGILGRKIKPIFHEMTNEEWRTSRSGAQQRACETWTQDNQVFAAVSTSGNFQYGQSPLYGCLAKANTPFIFADNLPREQKLYERLPSTLYTPGLATVERFGPGLIRSLSEQKYFTGWNHRTGSPGSLPVKVGVLYSSDEPGLPAIYKPALAKAGQRDPEFFELNAESTEDFAAAAGAAVLRFREKGVTHVLTNGALLFFAQAASSQGYRPRLGVTTWDALNGTAPATAESLRGALGAGYLPHLDVTQAHAPKDNTAVETRCRKIMEKGGQTGSDRTTVYSMLTICEDFWLIENALKRGGALTTAAMRAGVESQTQPVPAGLTFAMRYGPRQHDGAHAVRNLAYVDGAFRYTSGNRPLS